MALTSKKRELSEADAKQALTFKNMGWSIGKVAKFFKVNKPTILKALNLWDEPEKEDPMGRKYIIRRGQVYVTFDPTVESLKKRIEEQKTKANTTLDIKKKSGGKEQRLKRRNGFKEGENGQTNF